MRAILDAAGVGDILTKALGTNHPHNVVKATMTALRQLESADQVARRRGLTVRRMYGLPERASREEAPPVATAGAEGGAQ